MWYVCNVMYVVLYVRGCAVSSRFINVCSCDMFSVVLCVLMVESMSVVVNVMLSLISVTRPTPCFVQPIATHGGEVM